MILCGHVIRNGSSSRPTVCTSARSQVGSPCCDAYVLLGQPPKTVTGWFEERHALTIAVAYK